MGRFEKQPDNPRVRGDLSRSAENALWAVVEDLENLQQHVIRSMQEDIKRLQADKNRLTDDIQRLTEEKEQLQQVRQITEQQVLIRQLAEALAKHISSQLQSSLTTLANKAIEQESKEKAALKSAEIASPPAGANNGNVQKMLDTLDDTVTITFNSLQQELKNYQSSISQQLSRMHNQQQEGEWIIAELINRLQVLEQTIKETSLKAAQVSQSNILPPPQEKVVTLSAPTVLQVSYPQQNGAIETSSKLAEGTTKTIEPISVLSPELSAPTVSIPEIAPPPVSTDNAEPISVLSPALSTATVSIPEIAATPVSTDNAEPISVLSPELSTATESSPQTADPPVNTDPWEPISVLSPALSTATVSIPEIAPPPVSTDNAEPISVLSPELSTATVSIPEIADPPVSTDNAEPISVLSPELSTATAPSPETVVPPVSTDNAELISVLSPELSTATESSPQTAAPPVSTENTEPISVLSPELSTTTESSPQTAAPPVSTDKSEPISVPSPALSPRETDSPTTTPSAEIPVPPVSTDKSEPISVPSSELSARETDSPAMISATTPATTPSPKPETPSPSPKLTPKSTRSSGLSPIQIGFLLIVFSTVISSLYNVAIKVIFHQGSEILGLVEVDRLLLPSLGNILLILMLRLVVVVPLMLLLAPIMHPRVWVDLQNLFNSVRGNRTPANAKTQKVLLLSIASGCFLFLSQVLVYIAVGQIPTGMAIALFFVYPLVSALLSWFLLRDQPNLFRAVAIGSLFCGELLVLGGSNIIMGNVSLGGSTGILSGVAFGVYVIFTRICASKIHPVSFTLINFATMLLLSFICLIIPLPSEWSLVLDPSKLLEIILSAFILGVLTLCGYVLNNLGIGKLGASRAGIIGASVPILTVIFAGLLIQENLEILQIVGVLLVTFGTAAFSFEKMRNSIKPSSTN